MTMVMLDGTTPSHGGPGRIRGSKRGSLARAAEIVTTALDIQAKDAYAADQVGYMAKTMIWASMPHSEVAGAHYTRNNGIATISMLVNPEIGLPYGKIPRLIVAWVTREAKLTKSPKLLLGRSLSEFATKIGVGSNGGVRGGATRLKEQATRLFSSVVSVTAHNGQDYRYKNVVLSDCGMLLWNPGKPNERAHWESTVTLSEPFFLECIKSAVPFDLRVLHCLRSSLAIDLYLWLTWRAFTHQKSRRASTVIPWEALRLQLGVGYANSPQGMAHFRAEFRRCLRDVCTLYPQANVSADAKGLTLRKSPPHVPRLIKQSGASA
ncbi:replication protein RepA [Cupriavidus pinatubonensis]|uniref:Plasmid encoded RepA protein n=1 Tax=Cupriavidus pinatubonensis TaxID=248026 RepID=A0ABN7YAJ5_9BURK|nr:replication protein RepA [Cupriavidus pinatubonensis]CAG9170419.1 hypothetical protein LMG23994_01887 [Cupriavidus pinatubonensis]